MCRLIVGGPLSLSPVACVALLLAYSRNGRYLPAVPNLSGFCSLALSLEFQQWRFLLEIEIQTLARLEKNRSLEGIIPRSM